MAVPASLWVRLLAVVPAVALIWAIVRVSRRVVSANMASVWISLAYALWAIFPVAWGVAIATGGR